MNIHPDFVEMTQAEFDGLPKCPSTATPRICPCFKDHQYFVRSYESSLPVKIVPAETAAGDAPNTTATEPQSAEPTPEPNWFAPSLQNFLACYFGGAGAATATCACAGWLKAMPLAAVLSAVGSCVLWWFAHSIFTLTRSLPMFRLMRALLLITVAFSAGAFAKERTIQLGKDTLSGIGRWYNATPTDGFSKSGLALDRSLNDAESWSPVGDDWAIERGQFLVTTSEAECAEIWFGPKGERKDVSKLFSVAEKKYLSAKAVQVVAKLKAQQNDLLAAKIEVSLPHKDCACVTGEPCSCGAGCQCSTATAKKAAIGGTDVLAELLHMPQAGR
jgi:hypothetical protein